MVYEPDHDGLCISEIPYEKLLDSHLPPLSWTLRPCEIYKEEYKDCRSIKERFHQYFIHGEIYDCSRWKEDFELCMKYRKTGDIEALKEVIKSEQDRKNVRLEGNHENDVWEKREVKPPPNWNSPLPEVNLINMKKSGNVLGILMKEKLEQQKAAQEKSEAGKLDAQDSSSLQKSFCTIS